MNRFFSVLAFLTFLAITCPGNVNAAPFSFKFLGSTFEVIDSAAGAQILVRNDNYTSKLSEFDVQGRLQDTTKHTEEDYLSFAEQQPLNWTDAEKATVKKTYETVANFLTSNNMTLNLPPVVRIIKTTCKEEFGATAYTRSNNIVFSSSADLNDVGVAAHELFHVFSRYDEVKRNTLYGSIGFKRCNQVDLSVLNNLNITNPDCPVISHYITVGQEDLCIILYSREKYTGGNVFQKYMEIGFPVLLTDKGQKKIKLIDGKPVIHDFPEVKEIIKQIGSNTTYMLHPEEVLAEHFGLLVTGAKVQEPIYLERMKIILTKN